MCTYKTFLVSNTEASHCINQNVFEVAVVEHPALTDLLNGICWVMQMETWR